MRAPFRRAPINQSAELQSIDNEIKRVQMDYDKVSFQVSRAPLSQHRYQSQLDQLSMRLQSLKQQREKIARNQREYFQYDQQQ